MVTAGLMRTNTVSYPWTATICVGSNKGLPFVNNSDAMGMRARQVRLPFQFNITLNLNCKREKLANQFIGDYCKDHVYGVQFLIMGLENLKLLQ